MTATFEKIEYDAGIDEYYIPIFVDDGKHTFTLRLDASSICPQVGISDRKLMLAFLARKVANSINFVSMENNERKIV